MSPLLLNKSNANIHNLIKATKFTAQRPIIIFSLTGLAFTGYVPLVTMTRILIWTAIFYILFRFVTRFLLPVLRVTRVASTRMREMQQQMEDMQAKANNPGPAASKPKPVEGDYIDYEEIK